MKRPQTGGWRIWTAKALYLSLFVFSSFPLFVSFFLLFYSKWPWEGWGVSVGTRMVPLPPMRVLELTRQDGRAQRTRPGPDVPPAVLIPKRQLPLLLLLAALLVPLLLLLLLQNRCTTNNNHIVVCMQWGPLCPAADIHVVRLVLYSSENKSGTNSFAYIFLPYSTYT